MFGWAKNAVGLTDKHHGAEALHAVTEQTTDIPYTQLRKDDLKWNIIDGTNVETKTFYLIADNGTLALVQVIYSNVFGVKTTAQFGAKIFSNDPKKPHLWNSDILSNFDFVDDMYNFKSQKCSMTISADGKSYTVKSTVNPECTVDLTFTQAAPGFMAGKDGTSYFGPTKPPGRIWHKFWPRCKVEGTMTTKDGPLNMQGKAIFIHALQGMKPHFASAKWNFCHFQSSTYAAVSMEFITPPSYDNQSVSVGGVAVDGKIIIANAASTATHVEHEIDPDSGWPQPKAVTYTWTGKTDDGKHVSVELKGIYPSRMDRIDIMAEVPKFLRNIVSGAMGAKPFIYQFGPKATIRVDIGGEVKEEEGRLFAEATFVS